MLRHGGEGWWLLWGAGDYALIERVPVGWVLSDVTCVCDCPDGSTYKYIPGEGVAITYVIPEEQPEDDLVVCTFTNSPAAAVGGVVLAANTFALVSPWLAVIGLVACIGAVVVAAKKRQS